MSAVDYRRRRVATFMALADEEMKASERLLEELPRQSAFFQQQAAEKMLRAVLEVESIPAGPTHNLRTLTELLASSNPMRADFLEIEDWSSAATRFRYPGGSGEAPTASVSTLRVRAIRLESLWKAVGRYVVARTKELEKL